MGLNVKDTSRKFSVKGGDVVQFEASDEDTNTDIHYFSYVDSLGHWIIQESNRTTQPVTHRYISGLTDLSTSWALRASLAYDTYDQIFPTLQ